MFFFFEMEFISVFTNKNAISEHKSPTTFLVGKKEEKNKTYPLLFFQFLVFF